MIMSIVTIERNVDKDVAARTDAGKRFQVLGAATGKAGSPKVDLRVDGATSVVTSDERRR